MTKLLNLIATIWVTILELTYLKVMFEAQITATQAGYDQETRKERGCEAAGLAMLQDCITQEVRISRVRAVSFWENILFTEMGARSGITLHAGGWTQERIMKKAMQLEASAQGEA